mmetsp:Transcript_25989/g.66117  ORF Transcript_25989/g.66117 Transcript_25989/m.66117 type:complete len:377 (-) Transcript_25989:187-1317(-)
MTYGTGIPDELNLTIQPKEEYLGERGVVRYHTNPQGYRIASYYWPCHGWTPRGIVYLCHGHGGYIQFDYLKARGPGKLMVYAGSWVEALNAAGFSVCGLDNQGSGRSEGTRCYTDALQHYVTDLADNIRASCKLDIQGFPASLPGSTTPVPKFVMGSSMGGCLATLVSMDQSLDLSGLILLAPMLSLEKLSRRGLNPYLRSLGFLVSSLFPKLPVAQSARNTLYPDLQEEYDADVNCWHGKTRARNAMEYLAATQRLMAPGGLEAVAAPFLLFHGLKDDMTDPDGSRALHARAKSTDKTIKLLPDSWHVLTKEPGVSKEVLSDILAWVSARCDAGPASPTSPAAHSLPTPNGGSAAAAAAAGAAAELPETLASPKP